MKTETILIVDDEKLIRWSIMKGLSREGYRLLEASTKVEAIRLVSEIQPDLIILDQVLSDGTGIEILQHFRDTNNCVMVVMLTAVDRVDTAVQAMKLGAFDYVMKPVNMDELSVVIDKAFVTTRMRRQLDYLQLENKRLYGFDEIVGASSAIQKVKDFILKASASNTTNVLITGESGTGKELIARAIHQLSKRSNEPLITVTCPALTETLIESELFGHEKGAFTDAKNLKKGIFEVADKGTVFLDEIGDVSLAFQVKLLRVLEQKTFRRVGGTDEISVDTRIIAATNRGLEDLVAEGKFRHDLYYRLNVFQINVPPLKERGDDILLLAEHFLKQFNRTLNKNFKGLSDDTKTLFMKYHWPGNVRELKNVIERAVLLDEGEYIFSHQVTLSHFHEMGQPRASQLAAVDNHTLSLNEIEQKAIQQALETAKYNQSEAARLLKITRETLRYRMKKYGLLKH